MPKFIRIDFYPVAWSDNSSSYNAYAPDNKPSQAILSLDAIKHISPKPMMCKLYDTYDSACHTTSSQVIDNVELHCITTDIAYGRGINGVDYYSYRITADSYKRLLNVIDLY